MARVLSCLFRRAEPFHYQGRLSSDPGWVGSDQDRVKQSEGKGRRITKDSGSNAIVWPDSSPVVESLGG